MAITSGPRALNPYQSTGFLMWFDGSLFGKFAYFNGFDIVGGCLEDSTGEGEGGESGSGNGEDNNSGVW